MKLSYLRNTTVFVFTAWIFVAGLYPAVSGQDNSGYDTYDPVLYSGLDYRMIGPHRGGRVTAVAGHAEQPGTFYMGATGGGVWKTTDYGKNWRNISDGFFEVGSIGSIDVADSNPDIIYVGTGSAAIRSNVSTGRGVYKSLNGGRTWQFMGLRDTGQIGTLIIHPENPDIVYLAALGHPFGPNPERGVYRTLDGGETWENILFISEKTGAIDLSMNSQNPKEIFAAMWRGERKPWTIISGSTDGGLFKTQDGGENWMKLTAGLPEGLVGKISISVSPADPQKIYALIEAPDDKGGVYRSDDGGQTFTFINGQKSLLYRPFYYTYIDAHPKDPDVVYVNNEGFYKSTDGGEHFQRQRTPHGDNHGMWINPDKPDIFIQSNDGGANVTIDGGETWSTQYNQPTAEMYHVVLDNRFPYWVYGEQQDNSTIRIPSLPPVSGRMISPIQFWQTTAGCETGPLAVHPLNPDIVYGGCKGRFSRYNHATGQEQQYWVYPHFNYGHAAKDMPFRFQRTSPIEISPHNPEVIYHASQVVHKTTDEGRHWEIISPDLTANEPDKQGYSGEPITRDITGEEIYSAIYQLRESLLEEGVIWAGSNDGLIHITRDGGKSWTDITPPGLPSGGRVQTIEPSYFIPGRALIAVYRYMLDDWAPYIYKTEDYGSTWTLLTDGTNGIPADHPTRVVREDPDRLGLLYAGTEFGMFVTFDDGGTWQTLQLDLPAVPVTDIKVHQKDLVLSTMGRSFWILDDITPLHQLTGETSREDRFLFKPRTSYRMRRSGYWGGLGMPEYPPAGVLIYYYLAQQPEQELTLKIMDERGNVIRNYSSGSEGRSKLSDNAGMHRFNWDLRYPGPVDLDTGRRTGVGPLALPGRYQVKLEAGDWSQTRSFQVMLDPRVAADGVTQEDLKAQLGFNLHLRETISRTHLAIRDLRQWKESLQDKTESENRNMLLQRLTDIENKLIQTQEGKVGAQLEPKLIRQLQYLAGMTRQADQKPGEDAYQRLNDIEIELEQLMKNLETLRQAMEM
jgi:photosystem II stability/assembly factor-like uncharacterized protein